VKIKIAKSSDRVSVYRDEDFSITVFGDTDKEIAVSLSVEETN